MQEGAKILSADGATIEVVKMERQKATKLMELERLGRVGGSIMSILVGKNLRNFTLVDSMSRRYVTHEKDLVRMWFCFQGRDCPILLVEL